MGPGLRPGAQDVDGFRGAVLRQQRPGQGATLVIRQRAGPVQSEPPPRQRLGVVLGPRPAELAAQPRPPSVGRFLRRRGVGGRQRVRPVALEAQDSLVRQGRLPERPDVQLQAHAELDAPPRVVYWTPSGLATICGFGCCRRMAKAPTDPPPEATGRPPTSLAAVAAAIQACRRCELWAHATQGVAGEGPAHARIMLVGEQPGDQEDQLGKPFVGPAGQLLDRALGAAGVDRQAAYVTNAVKHFKNEPRGKRRLHKTPNRGEIAACRWWLDNERRLLRPRVIVAMGGSAVLAVFGKPLPILKNRGQAFQLPDQAQGLITVHPSSLLRMPAEADRDAAFAALVRDFKAARALLE